MEQFNSQYRDCTSKVAGSCQDLDLSDECMVIGTSAIIDTEIDGAVGMNSYKLPISFQFHHAQMDGAHAGKFLANLQIEIKRLHL